MTRATKKEIDELNNAPYMPGKNPIDNGPAPRKVEAPLYQPKPIKTKSTTPVRIKWSRWK